MIEWVMDEMITETISHSLHISFLVVKRGKGCVNRW